ncbi:MAG: OPT/YSL family transporter [Myxococcota bacterium]|nr:OPT/YSL family transporter [Myxococcota bacterium]
MKDPVPEAPPVHDPAAAALMPAPLDRTMRQFTVRAVVTGMVLGGLLSICNVYSGLMIGWSNNMSVTAALLGFAFWKGADRLRGRPGGLTILENNLNQTAASSGASISSAGLVAAVPALTMLTGIELSWPILALWTFSVCCVGITVGIGLRRQMILIDKLPFPNGIAAAQTLKEMYASGAEAVLRVQVLVGAAVVAAGVKLAESWKLVAKLAVPGGYSSATGGPVTLNNLTFALEPNLLMVGVGGLIGLRAGLSLLLGAVVAYGVLGPVALGEGWATAGDPAKPWFGQLNKWLLWPGVTLMVTSSLTSFAFSWRSFGRSFRRGGAAGPTAEELGEVSRRWFLSGLAAALILSVVLQVVLFDIFAPIAAFGVLMSFLIAVIAARVSGETNVTPVGPMGKITQLLFGALTPGQVAPNLMAANVTGGAASQCADLMHDLKAGHLLGALPRYQAMVQVCGALAGALVGSAAYLILVPDPRVDLVTEKWPAPAVATWRAVAEVFAKGFDAMPAGAVPAIAIAGAVGVMLAVLEKTLPPATRRFVPSASAIGLGFVLPAYNSISMCFGAIVGAAAQRISPAWSVRFVVVIAAGLIAGESLAGATLAISGVLGHYF